MAGMRWREPDTPWLPWLFIKGKYTSIPVTGLDPADVVSLTTNSFDQSRWSRQTEGGNVGPEPLGFYAVALMLIPWAAMDKWH